MIDKDSSYWEYEVDTDVFDKDIFENSFDLISSNYRAASAETHIVFNEQSRSNDFRLSNEKGKLQKLEHLLIQRRMS